METSDTPTNPRSKVRIVTPPESPSRPSAHRQLTHDIAALYSSNESTDDTPFVSGIFTSLTVDKYMRILAVQRNRNSKQTWIGEHTSSKGKEKRVSAPAIMSSYNGVHPSPKAPIMNLANDVGSPSAAIYALPHSHLISPPCLPLTLPHQVQRSNRPVSSNSFNMNRSVGTDLSPIMEDIHAFAGQAEANEVDSSGSSYGQLLTEMTIDYFNTNTSQYGAFGKMEWGNDEKSRVTDYSAPISTQGYGDIQDPSWAFDHLVDPMDQNVPIPELTLTAPTPDLGSPEEKLSDAEPRPLLIDDIIDHPLRQKKTSTVAASKKEGSADLEMELANEISRGDLALGLSSNRGGCGDQIDNSNAARPKRQGKKQTVSLKTDVARPNKRPSSFRWSISRSDRKPNDQAMKRTTSIWKRMSQILGDMTETSSQVRHPGSNRTQLDPPFVEVAGTWTMPASQLETQKRCPRHNAPGKRDSDPQTPATPVCIHEEGEHAASRLFGLPSTREASSFLKTDAQHLPRIPDKSEKRRDARRHSFGFNMKSLAKRRRYADSDKIKEA
ncbi:hypothetical protein JR316_0000240 [Psilocybe cubensis]|nr:hypothetical protein JR316_0000240 [Psilocybe cubensis]KAH9486176.1 hypothetical protein JR316_0000240 [Psilocybe cubensis]